MDLPTDVDGFTNIPYATIFYFGSFSSILIAFMKVKGKLLQFNLYMLTKLQKISFGKNKNKLPHRGSNPHQLRNHPNSTPFITDPFH